MFVLKSSFLLLAVGCASNAWSFNKSSDPVHPEKRSGPVLDIRQVKCKLPSSSASFDFTYGGSSPRSGQCGGQGSLLCHSVHQPLRRHINGLYFNRCRTELHIDFCFSDGNHHYSCHSYGPGRCFNERNHQQCHGCYIDESVIIQSLIRFTQHFQLLP